MKDRKLTKVKSNNKTLGDIPSFVEWRSFRSCLKLIYLLIITSYCFKQEVPVYTAFGQAEISFICQSTAQVVEAITIDHFRSSCKP